MGNFGLDDEVNRNRIENFILNIPFFKSKNANIDFNCNCVYIRFEDNDNFYCIDVKDDIFYVGYSIGDIVISLKVTNYNINTIDFLLTDKMFHFNILKFYYIMRRYLNDKLTLLLEIEYNHKFINCEYDNKTKKVSYNKVIKGYL